MRDARLEVAAPRPGETRSHALAELADARAFWEKFPHRRFELRYAGPKRTPTPRINAARHRQAECSF